MLCTWDRVGAAQKGLVATEGQGQEGTGEQESFDVGLYE